MNETFLDQLKTLLPSKNAVNLPTELYFLGSLYSQKKMFEIFQGFIFNAMSVSVILNLKICKDRGICSFFAKVLQSGTYATGSDDSIFRRVYFHSKFDATSFLVQMMIFESTLHGDNYFVSCSHFLFVFRQVSPHFEGLAFRV